MFDLPALAGESSPPPTLHAAPGCIAVRIQDGDRVLLSQQLHHTDPITIGPSAPATLPVLDTAWQDRSLVLSYDRIHAGWQLRRTDRASTPQRPRRAGTVMLDGALAISWHSPL